MNAGVPLHSSRNVRPRLFGCSVPSEAISSSRDECPQRRDRVPNGLLSPVVDAGAEVVEQLIEIEDLDPRVADQPREPRAVLADVHQPAVRALDLADALELGPGRVQPRRPDQVEVVLVADDPHVDRGPLQVALELAERQPRDQPRDQRPLADALVAEQQV